MFFRVVLFGIILFTQSLLFAQTTDLLISEYVEGSSNNKYIEIYNGTGANVNLANYAIRIYFNGSGAVGSTINLSGTLGNGNVYVIANSSATVWGGTPDLSTGSLSFNGDDAVELYNTSTAAMVDLVGNIGCDPGSEWSNSGNSTQNNTIVRNANVCSGITSDPGGSCPFPTLGTEWAQFASNNVADLGSHTNSCSAPCVADPEPTVNASNLVFSNIGCFTIDLSWTSGNGANRIVVASTSPISGSPTDQNLYIANANFGSGATIAAGEYVVFNGSGNSLTVTGLSSTTTYYFAIFEFNGTSSNCTENYLSTGFLTDNETTILCSCPEIKSILIDACGGTIEGINEFFTFQNGNNSMPIDSLRANFPNGGDYCNSGCATRTWVTNPTYVAQLNTTAGCAGLFVEADPIPANAEVIVFTGSSPTYNFDFSGLCGTGPYYAVFANNTNTSGRFANYNSTCSNRTLNVDFGSSCSDAVTYNRCLLSNTDGAYVTFDSAGNPTYQNDGCTPAAVLPIELVTFTGKNTFKGNLLEWVTKTEINNDYFTIEKSSDAFDFKAIGTVLGAGNSNSPISYRFIDNKLSGVTSYYRLKQTDFDGKFSYSNVIAINDNTNDININILSNTLYLSSKYSVSGKLEIFDLTGRIVYQKDINEALETNLNHLKTGYYLYRFISAKKVLSEKFFIQ